MNMGGKEEKVKMCKIEFLKVKKKNETNRTKQLNGKIRNKISEKESPLSQ